MCQAGGTMLCSSGLKSANGCAYLTPTRRSAAAPARIAPSATVGPPKSASARRRAGGASDFGGASADELGNVPGGHDHSVHSGALELRDLVAAADRQLRDRELPGRHVLKQVERALERILVAVGAREQEDLGIEPLERGLELFLVAHLDRALEAEIDGFPVKALEPTVLFFEPGDGEHAGVCLRGARVLRRSVRPPEQRETRRVADCLDRSMER